jgi:hypothetical protein
LEGSWRRTGAWAPRLRIEALLSLEGVQRRALGQGAFQLTAGRLSGCLAQVDLGTSLRVSPCATFDVGSLRASGGGAVENVHTRYMPWLAGGAAARVEFSLSPWLALEAVASVRRLARRDRFIFRPESLVYQVPAWSAGIGLGLLLRFQRAPGSIVAPRDIAPGKP